MAMSHMSQIVKINVFIICTFIVFKLVYFSTVNLDLHFKYKRIYSQLNDLVYMSYGKQMKLNVSTEFHLPFFFTLAVQICFFLPFLKYGLLLAIGARYFEP
jgi:hypothetical protein